MSYSTHIKATILVVISMAVAFTVFAKDEGDIKVENITGAFSQFDTSNSSSDMFANIEQAPSELLPSLYIKSHHGTPIVLANLVHHEKLLIDIAQASGLAEDYKEYLEQYSDGVYAEFARAELAMIALRDAENRAKSSEEVPKVEGNSEPNVEITSKTLLEIAEGSLSAISIEQLIVGTPLFPPIEGIPDEYWKGQQCSNCHQWELANLCEQGKTYLASKNVEALQKQHPFGGKFKTSVRDWAKAGCK
jgi:hypothetical protein